MEFTAEEVDLLMDSLDALEAMMREGSSVGRLLTAVLGSGGQTESERLQLAFKEDEARKANEAKLAVLRRRSALLRAKLVQAEVKSVRHEG